jgi:hypothetical protein
MTVERMFLVFAVAAGLAVGGTIVLVPASRTFSLPPYFWVIGAFVLFEGLAIYKRGTAAGPPVTMQTRLIGFGIALALMLGIPAMAGVQVKLF